MNYKPEQYFMIFSLLFGMILVFLTPPLQSPDELSHFSRAFQVSQGDIFPQTMGGYLPKEIQLSFIPFLKMISHPEEKTKIETILESQKIKIISEDPPIFFAFISAIYSPVACLPQVFGILVGKIFSKSPLVYFYLGRIFNLGIWILLVFGAIRLTPSFKWVFFSLALLPMSIFLASSLSTDPFTIGLSFYLIAVFLDSRSEVPRLSQKVALKTMFFLSILLSLAKPFYLAISFLFFIIPSQRWGGFKKGLSNFFLVFTGPFVLQGLWLLFAKNLYVLNRQDAHISIADQMHHVLQNPFIFLESFFKTFNQLALPMMTGFVGTLGTLDTLLPFWLVNLLFLSLIFTSLMDHQQNLLFRRSQKAICLAIVGGVVFMVSLSQYLIWTGVGAKFIDGIQGRYFLPIGPLFFLLFYNNRICLPKFQKQYFSIYIPCLYFISLGIVLYVVYHRYFG